MPGPLATDAGPLPRCGDNMTASAYAFEVWSQESYLLGKCRGLKSRLNGMIRVTQNFEKDMAAKQIQSARVGTISVAREKEFPCAKASGTNS